MHLRAAAADCSVDVRGAVHENIRADVQAAPVQRVREQQACSCVPAMQQRRPLYRQRLYPARLLRMRRYSILTNLHLQRFPESYCG